jgi:hypothetical protein
VEPQISFLNRLGTFHRRWSNNVSRVSIPRYVNITFTTNDRPFGCGSKQTLDPLESRVVVQDSFGNDSGFLRFRIRVNCHRLRSGSL